MEKHNADDTKVLDSSAVIYKNKFGVWQFRYWLKNENKYIRTTAGRIIVNRSVLKNLNS